MRPVSAELWYMALASEVGVLIRADDPHEAREELYAIQRGLKDPDLDDVIIARSVASIGRLGSERKLATPASVLSDSA